MAQSKASREALHAQILAAFEQFGDDGGSMRELSYALGDDAPTRTELRRSLKALCRNGLLVRVERDLYELPGGEQRTFSGTLHFSRGNFYVHTGEEVVQVSPRSLGGAMDQDRVEGRITIEAEPPAGEIDKVVEAIAPRHVVVQVSRFRGLWVGDSDELGEPVQITGGLPESVRPGALTRVEIIDRKPFKRGAATGFPAYTLVAKHAPKETGADDEADALQVAPSERMPKSEMLRFVDDKMDARTMLDQLAQGLGVDEPFSDEVMAQAEKGRAPKSFDDGGDDLSAVPFVTIDGATAKDFDDAVYAEALVDDRIALWVAIADVSYYVPVDSALDMEARERGCSVYLPGRVYPMLPPHLSDNICSLRPNELRRCSYVRMEIAPDGAVEDYAVGFGIMESQARLTYGQVQAFFDGGDLDVADVTKSSLKLLQDVRERRYQFRRRRGMLELDLPQPQVALSEDGKSVVAVEPSPRWEANRLIEECMLVANETIATFLLREGWPAIFRVHNEPEPSKVGELRHVLNDVAKGAKVPAEPTPRDLERVLDRVAGTDSSRVLSWLVLRVMPRAEYAVHRGIHFGLGTDLYLHYTSPIRRYPDLEVHRMIRRALEHGRAATNEEREVLLPRLVESASKANQGESVQTQGERSSDKMMRALHMQPHVGESFEAIISGTAPFGMFVSVTHPFVEGMVPIHTLGKEYFEYDERRSRLVGTRTGTVFQVGGTVQVVCTSVDVKKGNINFVLDGAQDVPRDRKGGGKKRGKYDRRGKASGARKNSGKPGSKRVSDAPSKRRRTNKKR